MPIEFNCPHCLRGYTVADSNIGKRVKCKSCGKAITVPDPSGLSFADDTREMRRPSGRHSSTKILPENRPRKAEPAKRNVPSDTRKLSSGAKISRPLQAAEPEEPKPAAPAGKLPPGKLPAGLKAPPKLKTGLTRQRPMPEIPRTRLINFVLLLGVAAVMVGFFLPWFTLQVPGFDQPVAGFQVPLLAREFVTALDAAGYGENPVIAAMRDNETALYVVFALYAFPLLLLYGLINDWRCAARGKSHWWIRILVFVAPALPGAAVYFSFREAFDSWFGTGGPGALPIEPMEALAGVGYGAWTFLGGWLLLLLAIFIAPKVKKPQTPVLPPKKDDEQGDVPESSKVSSPKLSKPRG
ncbi:MAG: hypothetical protein H6841_02115 [Planctomycetes bacterium]|nr:hypothetical protein [Planctomycetota bacterium]MCB9935145.1 hypothetical protein [Planctomycetota bacterium]